MRESRTLSVPLSEALELPISVERTMCRASRKYMHLIDLDALAPWSGRNYIFTKASTIVSFLTEIEIFQVSESQEREGVSKYSLVHPLFLSWLRI